MNFEGHFYAFNYLKHDGVKLHAVEVKPDV